MQSFAEDLKRRFDGAEVFYLSLADGPTFRDYTAEEDTMIGLFERLRTRLSRFHLLFW